jgi:hypothetical protein
MKTVRMFFDNYIWILIYGQATKGVWWMPWRQEAMKDVVSCDKLRGAAKQALIRGSPNGETHPESCLGIPLMNS